MARIRGKVPKKKWNYFGRNWNKPPEERAVKREIPKWDVRVSSDDPGVISSFYVDLFRARPSPERVEYVNTGLTLNVSGAEPSVIGRISSKYRNCEIYRL